MEKEEKRQSVFAPSVLSGLTSIPPAYTDPNPYHVEPDDATRNNDGIDGTLSPVDVREDPSLAQFASTNRDLITEELESKLRAAGYIQSDDPGLVPVEEWRVHSGVGRLELNRLRQFHNR
jgi:hypothetical protein